jgi:hypothetical protein
MTTSKFIVAAKQSDTWDTLTGEEQKQFSREYLHKMNYSEDATAQLRDLIGYQEVVDTDDSRFTILPIEP